MPVLVKYPEYEVPEAVYLKKRTAIMRQPTMIYYPYNGIHISFFLEPLFFGVHLPPGTMVQLDDTTIRIEGVTSSGKYRSSFPIQAAPHASIGILPFPDLLGQRDPLTPTNYFGPLAGGNPGDPLVWYFFRGKNPNNLEHGVQIPNTLVNGTVILPSMTINGIHYESQRLTFTQKTAAGVECAMCN